MYSGAGLAPVQGGPATFGTEGGEVGIAGSTSHDVGYPQGAPALAGLPANPSRQTHPPDPYSYGQQSVSAYRKQAYNPQPGRLQYPPAGDDGHFQSADFVAASYRPALHSQPIFLPTGSSHRPGSEFSAYPPSPLTTTASIYPREPSGMVESRVMRTPGASASTASADKPDLSHLTDEERRIIERVISRQKEEEQKNAHTFG
ncbi:unnamed protein product [Protopolystoma xenopodis]|uniref:RabBD domain-containing protein n=1 Tax=Protopolystoma xenopodis TaxID=117903 RepID=A0A448WZ90_9PLAT|nr:unnamed protein product [Protopolystoma xenopodis]